MYTYLDFSFIYVGISTELVSVQTKKIKHCVNSEAAIASFWQVGRYIYNIYQNIKRKHTYPCLRMQNDVCETKISNFICIVCMRGCMHASWFLFAVRCNVCIYNMCCIVARVKNRVRPHHPPPTASNVYIYEAERPVAYISVLCAAPKNLTHTWGIGWGLFWAAAPGCGLVGAAYNYTKIHSYIGFARCLMGNILGRILQFAWR